MGSVFGQDEAGELHPKLRPPSLLGVLFALISLFCFSITLISFNLSGWALIMCLALALFYGSIGMGEGSAWERGYPSTVFLAPIGVGSAFLPVYLGIKIYVMIYSPYMLAMEGRKYHNVSPTADPAIYADAGIIEFGSDATLDTSRSFGFKDHAITYCVAPVVSRYVSVHPHSQGPKVTFWAVGIDCCGNRGNFECDGAGDIEVRNAFTVNELTKDEMMKLLVPQSNKDEYLKAIEAAKATHNLRSEGDGVILVRWATDPEVSLEVWLNRAVVAVVLSCFAYAVVITLTWSTIHFYFDNDIKKLAAAESGDSPRRPNDPFMVSSGNRV